MLKQGPASSPVPGCHQTKLAGLDAKKRQLMTRLDRLGEPDGETL
jgi:hypothetical protein